MGKYLDFCLISAEGQNDYNDAKDIFRFKRGDYRRHIIQFAYLKFFLFI